MSKVQSLPTHVTHIILTIDDVKNEIQSVLDATTDDRQREHLQRAIAILDQVKGLAREAAEEVELSQ
jgi:flagellar biosynthesis regulator FlaF